VLARGCTLVRTPTSTLQTRTPGPSRHLELALVRSRKYTVTFRPILILVRCFSPSYNNVPLVIACMVIDDLF
jgi:hypothetical protein